MSILTVVSRKPIELFLNLYIFFKDILKQNWPTLVIDPKLQCVHDQTPVFGHRRPKNLKDLLVCSKLMYPPKEPKPKCGINPSKVCHNQNCKYCPKLDHSGLIKSTTTGRTFIFPPKITCKFNNLIYLITCKKCQSQTQHVGQTMNSIQMRFQKHLKDVEHCSNWAMAPPSNKTQGPTNVGLHFSHTGHSIHTKNVLEFIRLDPNSTTTKTWRETRENLWMHKLKSLKPFGINATDGSNQILSRPNRSRQNLVSQTQSVPSISDT